MDESYFHINPNVQHEFDIIFGLEFLIKNKFNYLLSI